MKFDPKILVPAGMLDLGVCMNVTFATSASNCSFRNKLNSCEVTSFFVVVLRLMCVDAVNALSGWYEAVGRIRDS